jgi:hypothetical protein
MCYARCVDWPLRIREGFALAAASHADRGAALARPGLSPSVAELATSVAREQAARDSVARRQWLRSLLPAPAALRATVRAVPPRALALLSRSAPPEVGRRWLAAAPLPRPGYVPDAELIAVLHKLAAREPD